MQPPRIVIPAFDAAATVGAVVRDVLTAGFRDVCVIDDGSSDDTARVATEAGARVLRHAFNRGKGAALRTALFAAWRDQVATVCTIDADGQHAAADLSKLVDVRTGEVDTLVLGVRDLVGAGAPRANQMSNGISNFFLSRFCKIDLRDTQCGLRRYPVGATLALAPTGTGYEFEAEIIVLAARAGMRIEQVPVSVHYPPEARRVTHFRTRRDVPRIIVQVLRALDASRKT